MGGAERTVGEPTTRETPERPDVARATAVYVEQHPLLVVAALTSLIALGHAVWIWNHRFTGGLDPDEAGYIANSLRIEGRLSNLDLVGTARAIGGVGNGVVLPALSVPFTLIAGRDPRVAMLAQPALMVLTAVASAGIARRMAGPFASIATGLLVASMPMMSTATQSYMYGLGVAAFLTTAMWALVNSDRASNRWIWVFGVALGAMVLTRTMALGFIPAAVLGAAVVVGWDLRRLCRVAAATALGLLLALPWYVISWSTVFDYLFNYGYGTRAGMYGSGEPLERIGFRWSRFEEAFGPTVFILLVASAAGVALLLARSTVWRPTSDRQRTWLAVSTTVVAGFIALASTTNAGTWFETPMAVLAAPALVAMIARGPKWYSAGLAMVITTICITNVVSSWWWLPYDQARLPSHYELGFIDYDQRFSPYRRDEHRAAAADWEAANRSVVDRLRALAPDDDDVVVTMSGNMQLLNQNSLVLMGELEGWTPAVRSPDTVEDAGSLDDELTPTADRKGRQVPRLLVLARHDSIHFPPDEGVDRFADRALQAGWSVVDTVPMPGGGEVQVLAHGSDR